MMFEGTALGADSGISKSEVSRIYADLYVEVAAFRGRSLAEQPFRYVLLHATYCKARLDHHVVSQAEADRRRHGTRSG